MKCKHTHTCYQCVQEAINQLHEQINNLRRQLPHTNIINVPYYGPYQPYYHVSNGIIGQGAYLTGVNTNGTNTL